MASLPAMCPQDLCIESPVPGMYVPFVAQGTAEEMS